MIIFMNVTISNEDCKPKVLEFIYLVRAYLCGVFASRVFKQIPEHLARLLQIFRLCLVVFLFGLQFADGVPKGLLGFSHLFVLLFALLHLLAEQLLRVLDFGA